MYIRLLEGYGWYGSAAQATVGPTSQWVCVCEDNMRLWKCLANVICDQLALLPNVPVWIHAKQCLKFLSPISEKSGNGCSIIMMHFHGPKETVSEAILCETISNINATSLQAILGNSNISNVPDKITPMPYHFIVTTLQDCH